MKFDDIVDQQRYPVSETGFLADGRRELESNGILVLPDFATPDAISAIAKQGKADRDLAYFKTEQHNVYLAPPDPEFPADHPRNRLVTSSKGCITDDRIPAGSALRVLYNADQFRGFLCQLLGQERLFNYGDPLSSINLHYANTGQELGWHFDNSSFSITLMVQPPTRGGQFEYVDNVRDADRGEMNFDAVAAILDGRTPVKRLQAEAGTLVIFRGRNSLHRVAPNLGERTRMLAVLAYNSEPDIALSTQARMTFYGRTG